MSLDMCLELSKLINQCAAAYAGGTECQNCVNDKKCESCNTCKCYDSCIHPLHQYNSNGKTYNCLNMAYNYVVKHFYRFASEIEYAFRIVYHAEQQNWKDNINVVSLGCGPSSELYGIINELQNQQSNLVVSYHGFDTNAIWQKIWNLNIDICKQHNITYTTDDMFAYYTEHSDEHIDILILNYLLSDVARNMQKEEKNLFLDKLAEFIDVKDVQYVIFNDIPLFYDNLISGYSCMEYVVRQFGVNKQRHSILKGGRYRFGVPNQYQPTYGRKCDQSSLLFIIDDAAKDFQPFNYCNSIQMLIKKTKAK